MDHAVNLLVLIIVALGAYATAAVAYHILAPWHETRVGRWYMAQLAIITASLALILLNRVFGFGVAIIYVIYGLFAIVGIGTAATVITTQVKQARADTEALDIVQTEERHPAAPTQEGQDQ